MKVKITTTFDVQNPEHETVHAEKREDGWYVDTSAIDGEGWRRYAIPEARERDVRQLLNKEYDARY